MRAKILPITALRDTVAIDKEINESHDPIIIVKNGVGDFVILPIDMFDETRSRDPSMSPPPRGHHHEPPMMPFPENVEQDDPLGFVCCGCSSINIEIGNVEHNVSEIKKKIEKANDEGVKVLAFQEMSLTGYTCGDMFLQHTLLKNAVKGLQELCDFTHGFDMAIAVGLPLEKDGLLYNCAVLIHKGEILGVCPKTHIPEYGEFYEKRYFAPAPMENSFIQIGERFYPFGTRIIYFDARYPKLKIAMEVCEDAWVPDSPSVFATLNGATLMINLSASNEVVGKKEYREKLISINSAKGICGYLYADCGEGESTTDCVYASHHIISENGKILSRGKLFAHEDIVSDIDMEVIAHERIKMTSFADHPQRGFIMIPFQMKLEAPKRIRRYYSQNPFVPEGEEIDLDRVSTIISMQASGLAKRLKTTHQTKAVVGLSGGLDSTLALLVTVEAFKQLGYDLKGITAITMPAFGTSKRTHDNAEALAKDLGVSFDEINIAESVSQHLKDISHSEDIQNNTYENAQARERTQVLMDWANDHQALMVGTGDLSELCIGWCTYNGDHMSMYGVNASIPKTLVKYLCRGYGILHPEAKDCLNDIIDTPISPELLPTKEGEIAQKTEDIVGPYELHDFFIYHFLRYGFSPTKIYFLAVQTYEGKYEKSVIKKWLREFFRRFFGNQFKRSCLPDGPKVGTVAISPRGDLRLPSDASSSAYLKEIDALN